MRIQEALIEIKFDPAGFYYAVIERRFYLLGIPVLKFTKINILP
jgi:hypothetical protein